MVDEDNATRAPESDAQEQAATPADSVIPGDTVVDQGAASMGEHCTTDKPLPPGATPTGELTTIADIPCYISRPPSYPHNPGKLLLLLTNGAGHTSPNNQIQADTFASHGYLVAMPDQFASDPAPTTHTSTAESTSVIEQIKLGLADAAKSFRIDMWLARHTPTTTLPILHKFLDALESEFADSFQNGGGVYAAGYCFGGKYVLLLASSLHADVVAGQKDPAAQAEEGMVKKGSRIKAGVLAHGTMVGPEDFEGVDVPIGIVAVENDQLFPDEVREDGVKMLKEKGGVVEQWVHEGVPHGFAVVGEYEDQKIRTAQDQAFDQMLGFLDSH